MLYSGKPKFTSRPRDARVTESEIIEFTCVAQGQPYPDVSWWNNNRRVQSTDRITVSNGGNVFARYMGISCLI